MFKLSEIKELVKLIDQSSLQELEIQNDQYRLSIRKPVKTESVLVAPTAAVQAAYMPQAAISAEPVHAASSSVAVDQAAMPDKPAADDSKMHKIVSPMVGTFYMAPSPDAPPYVQIGDRVNEKTVVCIVEAMKLMNTIEAEVRGEIVQVLVENGQLVEYGQPLFLVRPE